MGEQFLRKQAASFKHRSAAEYDRMKVPTLLTEMRPEALSVEFDCVAVDSTGCPSPGERLLLHRAGERLVVVDQNRCVGEVEHGEIASLQDAVDIGGGLLRIEVRSVSPIGGFFRIRVAEQYQ